MLFPEYMIYWPIFHLGFWYWECCEVTNTIYISRYSQILVIKIKLTFRHDVSLFIPTSENMAAVTVIIFAAAAITGKKKRLEDCF